MASIMHWFKVEWWIVQPLRLTEFSFSFYLSPSLVCMNFTSFRNKIVGTALVSHAEELACYLEEEKLDGRLYSRSIIAYSEWAPRFMNASHTMVPIGR
jgi:hypothetical protein